MLMNNEEQTILQKYLIGFLVGDVFNTVREEDVLKIHAPNAWEHKGKALTEGQVKALRQEADIFRESALWHILKDELKWHAYQNGYIKAKTEADMISSKVLEYLIGVIDNKLQKMSVI